MIKVAQAWNQGWRYLYLFFYCSVFWGFFVLSWVFLCFHMKFEIMFSVSVKDCIGILIKTALNLYIVFGRMAVFTILIFVIHEPGKSFHLLVFSSVFLQWVRFIPVHWCLVLFCWSCHFPGFFLIFISHVFIGSIQEGYWLLGVNFVSCYFAECVYQL